MTRMTFLIVDINILGNYLKLIIKSTRNRVHLNIIEKDFMLLGKMIFSLSVILFSSVNTTVDIDLFFIYFYYSTDYFLFIRWSITWCLLC